MNMISHYNKGMIISPFVMGQNQEVVPVLHNGSYLI